MKRARLLTVCLIALLPLGLAEAPHFSDQWLIDQIKVLTANEMAGRASGTPGADRAAQHISQIFQDAGLTPGGDAGGFLQRFTLQGGESTANVVGVLPGNDPTLKDEAVVIGGHYDHLGLGRGARGPARVGVIHPGADDNASGTATVMALARAFGQAGGARRTLVFVAFAGEEIGLLGSRHYAMHPPIPIEHTVAMLNFDMVGRLRNNRLYVMGTDSAREFKPLLDEIGMELGLELRLSGEAFTPSDHTPFYNKDRPVLTFYTGHHEDYHKPSDTWDKVNGEGLRRVTETAYRIVSRLANQDEHLTFVKLPPRPGRNGPYLGITPDFSEPTLQGVRLGGVLSGSPAEKAGLKQEDLIVTFSGVQVSSFDDLVFAIRSRRAGDTVEVIYQRDGTEQRVNAILGKREE
jgi:hypothetical protein